MYNNNFGWKETERMERPTTPELIKAWKKLFFEEIKKPKKKRIDCGDASRNIATNFGGNGRTNPHILYAKPHHIVCSEIDIEEAENRFEHLPDRIAEENGTYYLYVYEGDFDMIDPEIHHEVLLERKIELKPGMLLYSAETSRDARTNDKWKKWSRFYKCTNDYSRWEKHHMVMYVGEGKVMDIWLNEDGDPKVWEPVYSGKPTLFVALTVLDPFQEFNPTEIKFKGSVVKRKNEMKFKTKKQEKAYELEVTHLNNALIKLEYLDKELDHVFDDQTEAALMQFQKDHQLTADGVYGACSCTALTRELLSTSFKVLEED